MPHGICLLLLHICTATIDLGGITIEDEVQIGPRVNLVTENHPVDHSRRNQLDHKSIHKNRNAWIGEGRQFCLVLQLRNSLIAAGALVNKDVQDNTIVGGVPAKVIQTIEWIQTKVGYLNR